MRDPSLPLEPSCAASRVLEMLLLLALAHPTVATAMTIAVAEEATAQALQVTVAPELDNAALLPRWIAERNPNIAAVLKMPEHQQWISIEVGGVTYDYHVMITAKRDGSAISPPEALRCECNEESLLALIDEEIAGAVAQLQATPVEQVGRPAPLRAEPPPRPAAVVDAHSTKPRLSALTAAGLAVGTAGAVGLGAGIAFTLAGEQELDGRSKLHRSFELPGYVALSVGASALVAGTTMVIIDVVQCRRRPALARCRDKAVRGGRARRLGRAMASSVLLRIEPSTMISVGSP